ncbi:dipicolinate synthase subunit A [Sporosarcina sp. 179-K 3D1 HS]|uniref:dipicolinate synthase subunit A n=1 Tax=Sporosarcina sp. 179-K 3D1 HS TaxID=3232169 RepID=UPI0039A23349
MTNEKWLFIGTDERIAACSEIFKGKGYHSTHFRTDHYTEPLGDLLLELEPDHIVLPILQMQGSPIPVGQLTKGTRLYTGVASEQWTRPFEEAGHTVLSYLKEEQFIWENARLTAEAFVHEYYRRTKRSIAGKHFYVAGFGRVGKLTTHVLSSLGAQITVIARSETQLGEAATLGYETMVLSDTFQLHQGEFINTIPVQWLSVSPDSRLHIFDLASAPGCLKKSPAPEYYTILLGLPGKHFPEDAAMALAGALGRMYRK